MAFVDLTNPLVTLENPVMFEVKTLNHVTTPSAALGIMVSEQDFAGYSFEYRSRNGRQPCQRREDLPRTDVSPLRFTCFHIETPQETREAIFKDIPPDVFGEEELTELQLSRALRSSESPYGSMKFQVGFSGLLDRYRELLGDGNHALSFVLLGTQVFQQERNHVILICSQQIARTNFNTYPDLLELPESFPPLTFEITDNRYTATRTIIHPCSVREWENITLAFLQPEDAQFLGIPQDLVTVSVIERTKPVVPIEPYGGRMVSVQDASSMFVTDYFNRFVNRGQQQPQQVRLPASFKKTWKLVWRKGQSGIEDLLRYETGTSFATADGPHRHFSMFFSDYLVGFPEEQKMLFALNAIKLMLEHSYLEFIG